MVPAIYILFLIKTVNFIINQRLKNVIYFYHKYDMQMQILQIRTKIPYYTHLFAREYIGVTLFAVGLSPYYYYKFVQ